MLHFTFSLNMNSSFLLILTSSLIPDSIELYRSCFKTVGRFLWSLRASLFVDDRLGNNKGLNTGHCSFLTWQAKWICGH